MRKTQSFASVAVFSALLLSCSETTTPITQEQSDQLLAATVAGATVDPNAETAGGHTPATVPAVSCTMNATTKTMTCASKTNGLNITREVQFFNGAGAAQLKPDTSTRSMKSKTTVSGTATITSPNATGTTTVNRVSIETVTGLGPASTQRVVNGTASGTEDSEGKDARGTMSVKRQYADTTKDMTLSSSPTPLAPFPLSGTTNRNIKASVSLNGAAAKDYTTREVLTYEAGGKLTIKTTMNGQTRTCVLQLGSKTAPVCNQG